RVHRWQFRRSARAPYPDRLRAPASPRCVRAILGLVRTRVPGPLARRASVAVALVPLIVLEMGAKVYAPGLKADWRACATELAVQMDQIRGNEFTVFVKSSDPVRNKEIETARYYLPERCRVIPLEDAAAAIPGLKASGEVYVVVGSKQGVARLPLADLFEPLGRSEFAGLTVYQVVVGPRSGSRRSAASGHSGPD